MKCRSPSSSTSATESAGAPRPSRRPAFQTLSGYLWALAAVFFWGAMFPVGDFLMKSETLHPASVGMLRYLIATPVLLGIGCLRLGPRAMLPASARDWLLLCVLGLVGGAAMAQLLFMAQRTIASVNASLLEAYVPIQVVLLGLLEGKRIGARRLASIAFGFLGTLLILRALDGEGLQLGALRRGDLLIFLSGLCWSIYTAWGRGLARRLGGLAFTAWTVFFAGLWLLLLHAPLGIVPTLPHRAAEWGGVLFLALLPTSVSFFGWNEAQKTVPLAHLSFLEYFTPFVAAVCAVAFRHDVITAWQWIGIAVVIASAALQERSE